MYIDGTFILVNVPKRVHTSVVYQDFKDIVNDFPLNQYEVKIVECTSENYKSFIAHFNYEKTELLTDKEINDKLSNIIKRIDYLNKL